MQSYRGYSTRRADWPVCWHARPDADPFTEPMPVHPAARDRTYRLRRLFLRTFRGHAPLDAVGARAEDLGLLDGLAPGSMRTVVQRALRPICLPNRSRGPIQGAYGPPGAPPLRRDGG
jgi:hypothetical protein